MYVAVKGGEKAIENAHRLLAQNRRGDTSVPEISIDQIRNQFGLAVDRVMCEASLFDPELAALALKQAAGDAVEAVFLLRAYRTTIPRLAVSKPLDLDAMTIRRRISGAFKDMPGGQVLGPTFDYTHRLLDFSLASGNGDPAADPPPEKDSTYAGEALPERMPGVTEILAREDIIEKEAPGDDTKPVGDITRHPLSFPAERDERLQSLARSDEGFLLSLGYSVQRGYGATHPFVGEIRMGEVAVSIAPEELGFEIEIGEITVTECDMINQFAGSKDKPPQFTRGYGLVFGNSERKAMSMALVDRALRARELGEDIVGPAQDEEFVMLHGDNVEASGFVSHLKLPHHVDFQSELLLVRSLRAEAEKNHTPEEDE